MVQLKALIENIKMATNLNFNSFMVQLKAR